MWYMSIYEDLDRCNTYMSMKTLINVTRLSMKTLTSVIHVCLPLKNAMLKYVFEDLDECDMGFCGEHGTCTNTVGSYVCTCFSGFLPGSDGICIGEAISLYLVRTLCLFAVLGLCLFGRTRLTVLCPPWYLSLESVCP